VRAIEGVRVPIKIWASTIEEQAETQLRNISSLPFVFHHVAAMADAHVGIGATVGSVVATTEAICPAAVGVDIGCGMIAQKTNLTMADLTDVDLGGLRGNIERSVPVGFHQRSKPLEAAEEFLARGEKPKAASDDLLKKSAHQLGTLGGGNHFIELCSDARGFVWVVLHSGSRNIGKTLAEIYIGKAKKLCASFYAELADPNLAYLPTHAPEFHEYVSDLRWCQEYALANREAMMEAVLGQLGRAAPNLLRWDPAERVNCHHNYVSWEYHFARDVMVTRKGAIRARQGDLGIIPGSMGTGSFIVRGLGNPESFDSAPHGAGRRMSRTQARKTFTREDLADQTRGVECRKDASVIDEIPGAYKDIRTVMQDSSDLVEIVAELKQFLCVKG
jgi:tRNA-splicing ligase RtcB